MEDHDDHAHPGTTESLRSIVDRHQPSRRLRKPAAYRLLPDMVIDLGGNRRLFLGGEGQLRQAGVDLIEDEDFDVRLGLLLLPEAVEFGQASLDCRQQIAARLLDPFALGLSQGLFPEQVEEGQFVLAEALWTLLTKVETSCDRILIAGGANVEAEWEQGPAV